LIAALLFFWLPVPSRAEFVYVANADSGNVSAYRIDSGGGMTSVPGSPFAAEIETFSVAVDLQARFVYAANFSANSISAYRIGSDGALTPVPGSPFAAQEGPVSVTVDPAGEFVYVATSLSNNISAYRIGFERDLSLRGPIIPWPVSKGDCWGRVKRIETS
jgi:6-phosphogluconolactonase